MHHLEATSTFSSVVDLMVSETVGLLICGGDLIIHLQPEIDTSNGRIQSLNSLIKKVNLLLKEVGLIDVWREQHPNQRDYTY